MGRWGKILLFIILFLIIGGTGTYFYWQRQKNPPASLEQKIATKSGFAQPSPEDNPLLVEVIGLALVANLNLEDISEVEVEKWASSSGLVTIPAYTGPRPSLPPELATLSADLKLAELPATTKILAGYFKRSTPNREIVLTQGNAELIVGFNPAARLWKKEKNKLQLASSMLDNLLISGALSQYVQPGDLLLLPGIKEQAGQFKTSALVVFK